MAFAPTLVYTFGCLGPFGLFRLHRVPLEFRNASLLTGLTAVALGIYAGIGGNVSRPLLSTIGPLLSISAAILLRDLLTSGRTWPGSPT